MKGYGITSAVVAAATLFSAVVADVDPIVVKGSKFFYKTNGTEFFLRGVAYQQGVSSNGSSSASFVDPLADASICKRDIPYFQGLGSNVIRVYAIDATANHDECMQALQDAGIYLVSDLSEPDTSINRDSPAWDATLYARYSSVIDALAKYNNVLGFFAGNEVSNNVTNTDAAAFVKAAVRDMKSYIKAKNYRQIPVGYATSDDADIRVNIEDYFNCGPTSDSAEFWGYNIYSWCGNSSYTESGYDQRTAELANYTVPAFFAEYGCNQPEPREFTEVQALYGDQMTPVWSGGIVYEYFEETNNYGLVTVDGSSVSTLADYNALSTQLASISPSGVNSASYSPTNTVARDCPATGTAWHAASSLPPTPNQALCSCMENSLACVVNPNVNTSSFGDLFGTVCGLKSGCAGITANSTTGTYGAYSMCNPSQRLSWAFNNYFVAQKNDPSACNFNGAASTQAAASPTGSCQALFSQAGGAAGTGTVAQPTGSSTTTKKGDAGALLIPAFDFGLLKIGTAVLGAFITGAGMILL
jgi:hypothetical protein